MQVIAALAFVVALVATVYFARHRLSRARSAIFGSAVIRKRAGERSRSVATSTLFIPTTETHADTVYRAARSALPASEERGFTGGGTFVAHEQHHLVLAKIRHSAVGELGELVVSVENIDNTIVARFTVTSWQPRQGDLPSADVIETVRKKWLAGMYKWDKGGQVVWRDNRSLPKPGQFRTSNASHTEIEDKTVTPNNAVTIRRSTKRTCPSCGTRLPRGVGFCPQCGEDLVPTSGPEACVSCGEVARAQKNFCGRCGARAARPLPD